MRLVPIEDQTESMIFAFGCEEAAVLLQPGEMFREILDRHPFWADASRFLTPPSSDGGMLAVLPRAAAAGWLEAVAGHSVERDFQELLFEFRAGDAAKPRAIFKP